MYVIKNYIKYRKSFLFLYLVLLAIVCLNQYLYELPLDPIWYSFQISGFLFLILGGIDFFFFQKRYHVLENIQKENNLFINTLPKSYSVLEELYDKIIRSLSLSALNHINELERSHKEQMDYYTLWVHQIKTPISAIRLIVQEEEEMEGSKMLEQELFKIEQYVEMVLQYLRIQSLSSDLVLQPYSLLPIIKQCIKKYSSLFIYKKISLELKLPDITVITDEKWLAFVVEQILSNALKYTNDGGISISLTDLPGIYRLSIKDTGIGIRKEDIPRIFEKGYTGYNGRMDKKASGIGLYLTKQVADTLHHPIVITTEVNQGTNVTIDFRK